MKLFLFITILTSAATLYFYDAQALKAKDLPKHVHVSITPTPQK